MDWRYRAACLDTEAELFFPVGTSGPAREQAERAKQVCALCPVKTQCLAWALETNQDAGIWGGLDEEQRRPLRRPRREERRPPPPQR